MSHPSFEDGQDIRDRTFEFACSVVTFCHALYAAGGVGRLVVPQLVDCSTSCASMMEEAKAGESDADFISKCSIALKECREAWTRLRVCRTCQLGPAEHARALVDESNQLVAILTTIIKNKRQNVRAKADAQKAARKINTQRRSHEFRIPNS